MAERVWTDTLRAVEDVGVDVWAAQGTGVEDGGSPGQTALWSKGGAANPASLALFDLAHDLDKVLAEYEVVVGDWNVRSPSDRASTSAASKRNTALVKKFAV